MFSKLSLDFLVDLGIFVLCELLQLFIEKLDQAAGLIVLLVGWQNFVDSVESREE